MRKLWIVLGCLTFTCLPGAPVQAGSLVMADAQDDMNARLQSDLQRQDCERRKLEALSRCQSGADIGSVTCQSNCNITYPQDMAKANECQRACVSSVPDASSACSSAANMIFCN